MAAVYSARGLVEVMLEGAEQQELKAFANSDAKQSRKDFEATLQSVLPHYYLIEKLRIHDFHRFGCLPPDPRVRAVFYGGPSKLIARNGMASKTISERSPQNSVSGKSDVQDQRPLCWDDGRVFDDRSGQYLELHRILVEFLSKIPTEIAKFERLLRADLSATADPAS